MIGSVVQLPEVPLSDDEIVKCSCCREILTHKKFSTHKCKVPWKATKPILIHYYLELSDDGKEMLAVGHDGTHYVLKIGKPKAIPFIRRNFTGRKSDKDFTELYLAILKYKPNFPMLAQRNKYCPEFQSCIIPDLETRKQWRGRLPRGLKVKVCKRRLRG